MTLWIACFAIILSFSSCDVINQLIAAQGIKNGTTAVVQGDNSLPGAQKGGYAITNTPYKATAKPNGVRYKDHIFQDVKKSHVTYATNVKQYNGQTKDLMMDIYTPIGDNAQKRPAVIFVFGGGWFMKTLDGMQQYGEGFAMKGYVGVSVDYRLGFPNATGMATCKNNYSGFNEAWYRAAQDVQAAIRYLKANEDQLGIDENKIFIGGHSAGAFTTLNAVHLDDKDIPQALVEREGTLNSIGSYQNQSTTVAGEYILAGGAINTLNYVDKNVPTFIMQGTCDEFIENGAGKIYKCNTNPSIFAGQALNDKLKSNGACVEFKVVCGGDHGFGKLSMESQVAYVSSFIYDVLKGNCKTSKTGINAPNKKCEQGDPSVCN